MLDKKKIRTLNRLGQSGAVCAVALDEIAEEFDNTYFVTADMGYTSGMNRIMEKYPDKNVNVGIAEQSLVSVAAGIALEGNTVFAVAFASFITMRCFEQIRHNLGYMGANVKLIGVYAGVAMGMFGNTHYSLEDIALMREVPGMTVMAPADATEAYYCVKEAMAINGPVYIRLSDHLNCEQVFDENYIYEPLGAKVIKDIKSINVISCGMMLSEALKAYDELKKDGIEVGILDVSTIKPIDENVIDMLRNTDHLITIEEHSIIGGLGTAVAECLANMNKRPRLFRMGVNDTFPSGGDRKYVRDECGLNSDGIIKIVKEIING